MIDETINTVAKFNEVIASEKQSVFDFSATWCGPCKMLAPVFHEIAEKYKAQADFYKVDIDIASELAEKLGIEAVPTIIIFKSGKEVNRSLGLISFDELENLIK